MSIETEIVDLVAEKKKLGVKEVRFQRLRRLITLVLGWVTRCLGLPGFVGPIVIHGASQKFSVLVCKRFTVITVDGTDYYFERLTGRFAGSGGKPIEEYNG